MARSYALFRSPGLAQRKLGSRGERHRGLIRATSPTIRGAGLRCADAGGRRRSPVARTGLLGVASEVSGFTT